MRRALGVVISTLVAVLALAGFATPASAATGDHVKNFTIDYAVAANGVLQVKETIAYTFGDTGRHGIYRDLIVREPYRDDKAKDQKYEVSNIKVTASKGVSGHFTTETTKSNGDRDQVLRIKIGSENDTISGYDATYVITYDVRGGLRHFADHSELYWDATGSAWDAVLDKVTVNVTVPQGVQQVECFSGPNGSTETCPLKTVSAGKGLFGAENLPRGSQLTIVAGIKAGVVTNDAPIVVDPPSWMERNGLSWPLLIGSGGLSLIALLAAGLYARRGNKDQRFAGMPPGTFPPAGVQAQIVKDDLAEGQLPVAFSPPKIPVAEGGLLIDAKATTTETAATLIDLAVRGGLKIENDGKAQKAVLVNPAVATAPHEQELMSGLFPSLQPGTELLLLRGAVGDQTMRRAHDAMIAVLRQQVKQRDWYVRMPRAAGGTPGLRRSWSVGCFAFIALWVVAASTGLTGGASGGFARVVAIGIPVLAVIVALGIWIRIRGRGQRNPAGRAVTDQLVGFRQYLATAEADQLQFEEGEDIFSKYLPWAIAFDLADRWQKVCERLVAAGRLTPDPYWYVGPSYYSSGWTAGAVGATVAQTFAPPPVPASSGGGGGSSSGFSGGGFSGGGGGGGGGGSW